MCWLIHFTLWVRMWTSRSNGFVKIHYNGVMQYICKSHLLLDHWSVSSDILIQLPLNPNKGYSSCSQTTFSPSSMLLYFKVQCTESMFLDIDIGGSSHNESLSHLLFHPTSNFYTTPIHQYQCSLNLLPGIFREVLQIPAEQLRASFAVLRFVIDVHQNRWEDT